MQNFLKLIEKSKQKISEIVEKEDKLKILNERGIRNEDFFPIEYFMKIPNRMKFHKFYQDVRVGDVLIGNITDIYKDSLECTIMCTLGSFVRDIYSLNIIAICRSNELPIISNFCSIEAFRCGDKIKAIVSKISKNENLEISMNELSQMNKMKEANLGLISEENLPNYFKIYQDALNTPKYFNDLFPKNKLSTVMDINNKMEYFNINGEGFSLLDDINKIHISTNETAKSMRNSLLLKESMKYVVKGVNFYKMKKLNEALQCYNHALSINEENVDALVARGALRASSKAFESSIEDLEKAVKIDPNHKNAATYLSQTIIAYSKSLPESNMTIAESLVKRTILLHDDQQSKHIFNDIKDTNKFIVITDDDTNASSESSQSYKKRKNKRKKKRTYKESKASKKCIIYTSDVSGQNKDCAISIKSSNDSDACLKGASYKSKYKRQIKSRRHSSSSDYYHVSTKTEKDTTQHSKNENIIKSKIKYSSTKNETKYRHRSKSENSPNSSKRNSMHTFKKESSKFPNKKHLFNAKESELKHSQNYDYHIVTMDFNSRSRKNSRKNYIMEYSSKRNSSSSSDEFTYKKQYSMDNKYANDKCRRSSSSECVKFTKRFKKGSSLDSTKEDEKRSKHKSKRNSFRSRSKCTYSKMNLLTTTVPFKTQRSKCELLIRSNEQDKYGRKLASRHDVTSSDVIASDLTKENLRLKKTNDDIKQIEDFISSLKQNE